MNQINGKFIIIKTFTNLIFLDKVSTYKLGKHFYKINWNINMYLHRCGYISVLVGFPFHNIYIIHLANTYRYLI